MAVIEVQPRRPSSRDDARDPRGAFGAAVFAAAVVISWIVTFAIDGGGTFESSNETGYLVADTIVLLPLALVAAYGLATGRPWAPLALLLGLGASAYAALHLMVYVIREEFLSVPGPVYVLAAAAWQAVVVAVAVRTYRRSRGAWR